MINLSLVPTCSSVLVPFQHSGHLAFSTDTRQYRHPGAFVAIPGAKVNPLDLLGDLLKKECPFVFFQRDSVNDSKVEELRRLHPKTVFIPLSDSVTFLQELAHRHIQEWKKKSGRNTVFAISGSNGKTTHKEMLSFLLNQVLPGKVVATEKNHNNHLGVPLTLLNVTDQTEIVVLELGSNHPGEIQVLCEIAEPTAGITTNIGATHLEFFGTEDAVFLEEAFLYHAVRNLSHGTGFFLINADDPYLRRLESTSGTVSFGEAPDAQARISYLDDGAQLQCAGRTIVARNSHITGRHNKLNLITCLFIAERLYPEHHARFVDACGNFRPTKNRSEWIEFENRSVYLDAYNANPSSMKAALEGFKESVLAQGFKLADACVVLGDMNELGDSTPQYHKEVGQFVKGLGFPHVYFIGRFADHYLEGNPAGQARASCVGFKHEYRSDCLKNYGIHFIKGSRSLQLESLFDIT